jgi:hypothetical protein
LLSFQRGLIGGIIYQHQEGTSGFLVSTTSVCVLTKLIWDSKEAFAGSKAVYLTVVVVLDSANELPDVNMENRHPWL